MNPIPTDDEINRQISDNTGDASPQPAVVPQAWRDFVAEVVASAEGYERRTGQKVNAEWVQRGRALLAAPDAPNKEQR